MPKNEFTIAGRIDISEIMNGINQIKNTMSKEKLGEKLFSDLSKQLSTIEQKMNTTFKNIPGVGASEKQVRAFSNSLATIQNELSQIGTKASGFEVTDKYLAENVDSVKNFINELEQLANKVKEVQEKINNKPFKLVDNTGVKGALRKTETSMRDAAKSGNLESLKAAYSSGMEAINAKVGDKRYDQGALQEQKESLLAFYRSMIQYSKQVITQQEQIENKNIEVTQSYQKAADELKGNTQEVTNAIKEENVVIEKSRQDIDSTADSMHQLGQREKAIEQVANRIKYLFSITSMFSVFRQVLRGVIRDFQELDKEFNEIAIVSKYSTQEMWDSFAQVNQMAQEYGVTTKNILEVQNLYYHQGKDMAEVNKLTAQTLTLAKITGMDYAEATNKLTAALNAYKLEATDAVRVTDTVAALSANAATSSQELMTALTKTASIAANAGVSLENTEVFLTKMIETTREAPENLGTAMKTILARFGEVKDAIDDTGESIEMMDVNKVGKALKTIGISLLDSTGQMRNAEEVLMELSSKWDDLDRNTQRYIATQAAGSRQQSRFIAMMENYDRTLELVNIAQNSAGTGARQLAKAQESIETHLNRLRSAWQEFYSGIVKSGMIKWFIDLGNNIVGALNKISKIDGVGPYLAVIISGFSIWAIKTYVVDKALTKLGATIAINTGFKKANNAETEKEIGLLAALNLSLKGEDMGLKATIKSRLELKFAQIANNNQAIKNIVLNRLEEQTGKKVAASTKLQSLSFKELAIAIWGAYGAAIAFVVVAAVLVGTLITLHKKWAEENKVLGDTSELLDKLSKKQEEYNNQLQKTKSLKDNINIYEKYNDTLILTTEQQQEYNQAINDIAASYPSLINFIDEEGNYHLKEIEILKEEIEVQKQLNKEKRESYIKYKGQLAQGGVFGEDSIISQRFSRGIEVAAGLVAPEETDTEKQAKAIRKSLGITLGMSSFDDQKWWTELIKGTLEGSYQGGVTKNQLNSIIRMYSPIATELNDRDFQEILKSLSGQEFNEENIEKAFKDAGQGDALAKLISQKLIEYNEKLGGAFEVLTKQYKEAQGVKKQELLLSLDDIDFKFTTSSDANARFAEAFAEALPDISSEEFASYMQGLSKEKYDNIVKNIFNTEEITYEDLGLDNIEDLKHPENFIGDFLDATFTGENALTEDEKKIFSNRLKEVLTLTDAELSEIQNVLDIDTQQVQQLTKAQMKAMLQTAGSLTKNYADDQGAAKSAYNKMSDIINQATKDTNNFSKAINALNTSDLSTTEGIQKFGQSLKDLDINFKDGVNLVSLYNNGLENLEIDDTNSLLTTLNAQQENFNKQLESLGNLTEGKGTLDDLNVAINALTMGLDDLDAAAKIDEIFNSITWTSEGLLLDMAVIGEAGDTLLEQQVTGNQFLQAVYESTRVNALQAAKEVAIAVGKLTGAAAAAINAASSIGALKDEIRKIPGLEDKLGDNEDWTKAITSYTKSDLGARLLELNKISEANKKAATTAKAAEDAAKRMKEAWQNFVDYLQNLDRYSNLDNMLDRIKDRIDNLTFEIEFSTNIEEVKKDLEEKLNLINRQMAGNIAGMNVSQRNLSAIRNSILTGEQTKGYISFDKEGNILLDYIKLEKLQEKIRDAKIKDDQVTVDVLEAQYKAITDQAKAYTDTYKKSQQYTKGVQDDLKEIQDYYKKLYDNTIALEDKVIEIIQKREDKELEAVKNKYEAIKAEDDKYLDNVRKMVDKEREIRDRSQSEEDLKQKERKLSLMKTDTSGIYANEIQSLEKEIQKDRQDLADKTTDQLLDRMNEENEARAKVLDDELEFLDAQLEAKREAMTEYYDFLKELYAGGPDAFIDFMTQNDEEYVKGDEIRKNALIEKYKELVTAGISSSDLIKKGTDAVKDALEQAKQKAEDLESAIEIYGDSASVVNDGVSGSVGDLAGQYTNLIDIIDGDGESLTNAYKHLAAAVREAAEAEAKYNEELNKRGLGDTTDTEEPELKPSVIKPSQMTDYMRETEEDKKHSSKTSSENNIKPLPGIEMGNNIIKDFSNRLKNAGTNKVQWYAYTENPSKPMSLTQQGDYVRVRGPWNNFEDDEDGYRWVKKESLEWNKIIGAYVVPKNTQIYMGKFASGGLVNYTGPAWVDGTKSKPEAFLSASDTANIAKLRDVLSLVFDPSTPQYPNSSISNSNATYHITVEVGSIDSDYGVDKAISQIEEKINQASKYRNINILKKQN